MVLPFLTLYLTVDRRFSAGTAGLALTIYGIAAIVIAPISGRLSDRLGGLRIMKLSLFLSGLILIVFPFANSLISIFVMTGLWALVNEAFRPPSMSIIGDLAGPAQRKAAFALSRLAINLGMSIGPVIGGFLAMRSFKLLFYADATTTLLAGLLLVLVPRYSIDNEAASTLWSAAGLAPLWPTRTCQPLIMKASQQRGRAAADQSGARPPQSRELTPPQNERSLPNASLFHPRFFIYCLSCEFELPNIYDRFAKGRGAG